MDDYTSGPDWPQPGDQVAVLFGYSHAQHVVICPVDRLTATQIVLAGGRRFWRNTSYEVGNRSYRLCRPDDQTVLNALARKAIENLRSDADHALKGQINNADNALRVLRDLERLIGGARATVDKIAAAERARS